MEKINTLSIERIKSISKEDFLKNYYRPQRPVIIEELTKDWPAYKKWDINYFQAKAGGQLVSLYNNEPTKGKQKSAMPVKEMKLKEYLELLKTQPTDLRIFFYNILDHMPEVVQDFEYPKLGLKFFKRLPVMFFGGQGSKVLPHYDMDLSDLLHVHFYGKKSVMLFPPEQTKYIYKVPFSVHSLESIDLDHPNFKGYPALQSLKGMYAELKHGDTLYIPSGYWHYIKYLNAGFSITLRAFPKKPFLLLKMVRNIFLMRPFENMMRLTFGQKWVNYKESRMVNNINKKYKAIK